MVKVSIVTVCRNAEATIAEAIRSVLGQTYSDYEYIVIDGLSTDKTFSIAESFLTDFSNRGIKTKFFSEADNGIWDAMNKAINLAEGEWIAFINADDKIHDNNVLENIFGEKSLNINGYDVIYGDTLRVRKNGTYIGKANPISIIKYNMPFCHQGSFTKLQVMRKYMFDDSFRVADYNFFLSVFLDGGKFYYRNIVIADYSEDGYSNQNKYKTYLGTVDVRHAHNLINKNTLKQKVKNLYFRELLSDHRPFHRLAMWIDKRFSRRA